MGNWPDGIGPFQAIIEEAEAINVMFQMIVGEDLFGTTEHPREWGWVLRSSTQEWHQFLMATDKLLSENIDHKALTATGVERNQKDGTPAGSLMRLRWYLEDGGYPDKVVSAIVEPLRTVRQERQKPAHRLVVATTDGTLTVQRRDVLSDVGGALNLFRRVLQSDPKARDWKPPGYLDEVGYRL